MQQACLLVNFIYLLAHLVHTEYYLFDMILYENLTTSNVKLGAIELRVNPLYLDWARTLKQTNGINLEKIRKYFVHYLDSNLSPLRHKPAHFQHGRADPHSSLPLDVWDILVAKQPSSEEWYIAVRSRS
jgi:hypothetical protein